MVLGGGTGERGSILDKSWPDHLKRKRGDGEIMELKIMDMNRGGKAFLIDRVTGKTYYQHRSGEGIREEEPMDRYPMNIPGIQNAEGREIWWLDQNIFRPITFDSLEGASYYIDHLAGLHEKEMLEYIREKKLLRFAQA
jgi:hypothetical protein